MLRQRCSAYAAARSRLSEHGRTGSFGSENGSLGSQSARSGPKRLDNGRPAPLRLTPDGVSDSLPRLIRDGQDSARGTQPGIRPLPQPVAHPQNSRPGLPPLPPPPRSQPPPPPPSARTPSRTLHPPSNPISGRRTPTLPDPPAFNTSQPLPPAPTASLLTPTATHDSRQPPGSARQFRAPSSSPLYNSQLPNRNLTRSPNEHGRTPSSSAVVGGSPMKLPPRTTSANNGHPYALQVSTSQQAALSPISENFASQRNTSGTPSPPTSISHAYRGGATPFVRPNTPSHAPSLDDINRKVIKFCLPGGVKWSKISVADCTNGPDILIRALKKLRAVDDSTHTPFVETVDGALCVDGWGVFSDWSNDGAQRPSLCFSYLQFNLTDIDSSQVTHSQRHNYCRYVTGLQMSLPGSMLGSMGSSCDN